MKVDMPVGIQKINLHFHVDDIVTEHKGMKPLISS